MTVEYVVDGILPTRLTHIIGGASGSGKTTVLFQLIDAIAQGKEWLGYKTNPTPFAYISCDRAMSEVAASAKRIGCVTDIAARSFSTVNEAIPDKFDTLYDEAKRRFPDAKLFIFDGFGLLCEGRRSGDYPTYGEVARYLKHCTRRTIADGTTIIGSDHDAKTKHGQGYDNPKDRILGSSAWSSFSSTVIHIDLVDPANPTSPERLLHLFPRDQVPFIHELMFDDGRLVLKEHQLSTCLLDIALTKLPLDADIHRSTFIDAGERKGVKLRAVELWITEAVKAGKLSKTGQRGYYRRVAVQ